MSSVFTLRELNPSVPFVRFRTPLSIRAQGASAIALRAFKLCPEISMLQPYENGTTSAIHEGMSAQTITNSQHGMTPGTGRVLIADDQQPVLFALQMLLRSSGFLTETVTHPSLVVRALETKSYDAVLMDLNYTRDTVGGAEGLDLVSKIRSMDKLLPVVVMTAWSSVELAVDAMRRGASDFVQKPWENHELVMKLESQVTRVHEQRRAQRQRELELQDAREIQNHLLPKILPEVPGFEIAAMTRPLRVVGGDYFNVATIDDRRTAVCIADVAGKGMPAALLMSSLQATIQSLSAQNLEPREMCRRLNRILCTLTPVGKFISLFYGVLDSTERRFTYCNAGHNAPILIRADGVSVELGADGAVLGQFPDWQYGQSQLDIRNGDRLLLFTDGLVEARDAHEEELGDESLIRSARENPESSAHELLKLLMDGASRHCRGEFQDDASLIVLRAQFGPK